MEFNDREFIHKKCKFNLVIIQIISLILSFIFGGILILLILKYLNNINILNTFFILLYIYFFQLFIEFIKFIVLFIRHNGMVENIIKFIKSYNVKFLIINLFVFIFSSLVVFGCLLCSLFFSSFKLLFIFIMGIFLGIIYLFYTIDLFRIVDYKCNIDFRILKGILKGKKQDIFILILVNSLIIISLSSIFYLFRYLGIVNFIFITLVDLILLHINYEYLKRVILNY